MVPTAVRGVARASKVHGKSVPNSPKITGNDFEYFLDDFKELNHPAGGDQWH
jgi:hypothetical protein